MANFVCLFLYQLSSWLCRADLFPVFDNQKVRVFNCICEFGKKVCFNDWKFCLYFTVHTILKQFSCDCVLSNISLSWKQVRSVGSLWQPLSRVCIKAAVTRRLVLLFSTCNTPYPWYLDLLVFALLKIPPGGDEGLQDTFRALLRYPWAVFYPPTVKTVNCPPTVKTLYPAPHPHVLQHPLCMGKCFERKIV